jgi:EF hand
MKLTPFVSALALALTAGIAVAGQLEFGKFDTNADTKVTTEEFATGLDQTRLYNLYDTNADGSIDEAEFKAGTDASFKAEMDANKFDKMRYGDWAKWDKNADTKLDKSEFSAGLYNYYNTDTDPNVMTEAEWNAGASMWTN